MNFGIVRMQLNQKEQKMKKFVQTAVLIAGLAGLSACASSDVWTPYGSRTAGEGEEVAYKPAAVKANSGDMETLKMCLERENRLMAMNKACYRK